ncbi:MAG: type II secretion system minor pseudopilin GspK [Woeseiaceae bacterium]
MKPRRTRDRRSRNRGVALITAMLITALATIVAADLAWDNALDVRRTMVLMNRDQALQVALGAEELVVDVLRQDLEDSQTDHLGEFWAGDLPVFPIEGGEVWGRIEDLQGRFNVNNLVDRDGNIDQAAVEEFRRLLRALELDPRFAGIAADWIDLNQDAGFPDGAEDPIYTGFTPPYRSANQMLTSVSELAALEGMDKATFDRLRPHITALPGQTTINVNTATGPVLQALDENMSPSDVEGLLAERENGGFGDIGNTFASLVPPDVLNTRLDETTDYFQLRVVVRIDTVRITLYSTLQRGPNSVTPILRSLGTS